jgi:hypothetical protein
MRRPGVLRDAVREHEAERDEAGRGERERPAERVAATDEYERGERAAIARCAAPRGLSPRATGLRS